MKAVLFRLGNAVKSDLRTYSYKKIDSYPHLIKQIRDEIIT